MKQRQRTIALIGTIALASSLVACSNGPTEVNADDTEDQSQASDGTSIASINADNVEGVCDDALGDAQTVMRDLGVPEENFTDESKWGDEYFPTEDSDDSSGVIRCQGLMAVHVEGTLPRFNISVSEGDSIDKGNTMTTVSANGITAGILVLYEGHTELSAEDEAKYQEFLQNNVIPKFTP